MLGGARAKMLGTLIFNAAVSVGNEPHDDGRFGLGA
jgi:hypothetical protein